MEEDGGEGLVKGQLAHGLVATVTSTGGTDICFCNLSSTRESDDSRDLWQSSETMLKLFLFLAGWIRVWHKEYLR